MSARQLDAVLWITNISSPYRRPVWDALGERWPLEIAVLENDERLLKDGRRGPDWASDSSETYKVRNLRALRITFGESTYYLLLSSLRLGRYGSVLIGGWESPGYWQTLLLARIRGLRCVGFYESTANTNRFSQGPIKWARSWFFRHLDAVVVPGAAARQGLLSMGVAENRIVMGFNAVNVTRFNSESQKEREKQTVVPHGHRFIYVGQLISRKNVDGILRAFSSIRATGDRLTILGSGAEEVALRTLAEDLGCAADVDFISHRLNRELPKILAHQHTLVLASRQEVWGLVVNEALACGLQVVVSRSAGVTASISGMAGVFPSGISDRELAQSMRASREQWSGPIRKPSILDHTPEAFAMKFAEALGLNRTAGRIS